MNEPGAPIRESGVSLRQAALTAGFGLLGMVLLAPFAELYVLPKLIVSGDIAQTVHNLRDHSLLFVIAGFAYLGTFTLDVLVAWALYILLRPANGPLSLLVAWFRLIYTAIAFVGALKLMTLYRLVNTPEYLDLFGREQFLAEARLLLGSFGYEWSIGLLIFGIHLILLGYLVYRSGYIPKVMGALLGIAGIGYAIDALGPYFYPGLDTGFVMVTFFGELIFMIWLLFAGRKLDESAVNA